jgi:prolyl oligopeptidase
VDSGFYKPFLQMADTVPARVQKRLQREAARVIEREVVPAYRAFLAFVRDEYLPACPQDVGAWVQPDGAALYAHATRRFTTTELSPDQIHEIGLSEVARIRGEMQKIIRQTGFKGDFAAFLTFLRTDPQFYYPTSEALLEGYLALSKRIDPTMPRLFRMMPRMPYGVRPIPEAIAPDTTTAYYYPPAADGSRAGYYYVNLYRPETRPKWEMEALSLHEAVPGHHFQLALQQELGNLPKFRQQGRFTAFVEGWGLYAESLGEELGFYQDPYSKFGQLTYEMWRAM